MCWLERERGGGGLAGVCFCWFSEGARGVGMVWKGAQGGVVLRGWVQWYEVRGIWGKNWEAVWKKVPFRVAKIGSKELPVPPSGRDLYRKNDYTQ